MAEGNTRGKRRLGAAVSPLFKASKLTRGELAERAGTSRQTVGRLLTGDNLVDRKTLVSVLHELGLERHEIEHFKALHEVADTNAESISFPEMLADQYRRLRLDEIEAKEELGLSPQVLPGPLQTAAYAQLLATLPGPRVDEGWREIAPLERRERRALLERATDPLVLHAIIGEAALAALVALPDDDRREQIDELLRAGESDNVRLQVVPFTAGPFGADHLTLFTFPSLAEALPDNPEAVEYLSGLLVDADGDGGTAYADGLNGMKITDNKEDFEFLHGVWRDVQNSALSEDDSRSVFSKWRDKAWEG